MSKKRHSRHVRPPIAPSVRIPHATSHPPCHYYRTYKNAKFTYTPGLALALAHALSRELDQSTAVKHDPHAYATSDSQRRRNNDCNTAIEQGTFPEYDHHRIAGGSNQECRGLNSHEGEGRCDPLPRASSRANEVTMEQVERCELGAIVVVTAGNCLSP